MAGASPVEAYAEFLVVPLTSSFTLLEVLVASTPLLFTGAAVAIAFRAAYWNIRAEGQLLLGAIGAAGVGALAGDLPAIVVLPAMIGAGALAGAAWALVPALLRVRYDIDEVVTTLLLNPVALLLVNGLLHGPWRDPVTGLSRQDRRRASSRLLGGALHLGFVLAAIVVAAARFVPSRRRPGSAAGRRSRAARGKVRRDRRPGHARTAW